MRNALAALAMVAVVFAAPAQADRLNVSGYPGFQTALFTNVGSQQTNSTFQTALLGIENLDLSPGSVLPAYSAGLVRTLPTTGEEYFISTPVENAAVQGLFERYYNDSITSAAKASGFQIALWEILYDDFNIRRSTGGLVFRVAEPRSRDSRLALLWANFYLQNTSLDEGVGNTLRLIRWSSEGGGDLIQAFAVTDTIPDSTSVPLPAPLLLLGSALAMLGRRVVRRPH